MLSVTKAKEFPTSSTQTSKVINKTLEETRSEFQDRENDPGPIPKVCRICLAIEVKMYQLSEHKLKEMYERVTGIEIDTQDNLPQKLCWECVARLTSAKRFIEKALKTHWILMKKNKTSKCKTITDIKSIDAAQNKLESRLGTKHYKVNHSDFHIIEESAEIGHIYKFKNEKIEETVKNNCYDEENNFGCIEDEEEQIYVTKVDTSDNNDPIKSEQVDIDEEEATDNVRVTTYEADIRNVKYENDDTGISNIEFVFDFKEENKSNDDITNRDVDVTHQRRETRKRSNNSPTLLRNRSYLPNKLGKNCPSWPHSVKLNRRSNTLSHCKELMVDLNDITLSKYNTNASCEQLNATAASMEENKNNILETSDSTDNKKAVKNKFTRTINLSTTGHGNTSQTISTKTSNVNMSSSLLPNDNQHLNKLFICDICEKSFHHKSILIRHIIKHTKLYKYKCTYCKYKTYHRGNLGQHVNSKHTKRTAFICSYCSYKAYDKANLHRHVNSKHTKNTVFNCTYCNYKSYLKCNLKKHINYKHIKNTVFNCSYCNYKSYEKSNLNRHINYKHTKNNVT